MSLNKKCYHCDKQLNYKNWSVDFYGYPCCYSCKIKITEKLNRFFKDHLGAKYKN